VTRLPRGVTQRVTAADIEAGRIRIPVSGHTKDLFPSTKAEVQVVLKGKPLGKRRYDPRTGPDRERSGVLSVARGTLLQLVRPGERLAVVRNRLGVIYIGDRGSKLRIAQWVNERPDELGRACVATSLTLHDFIGDALPVWRSPLLEDDNLEFAGDLWTRLELPAPSPVEDSFWPERQPNWDAVATLEGPSGQRGVLLIEAKSHTNELNSTCSATSTASRSTILRALSATQSYLGVDGDVDWTTPYYQAANRLAFLYYLRARRNIPTWLFNVYFTGDDFEVDGVPQSCPADADDWTPALDKMHSTLQLPHCHALTHFAHDVFLPAEVSAKGD
jgi:hypothetical protein